MSTLEKVTLTGRCVNDQCVRKDPDSELYEQDWTVDGHIDEAVQMGVDGPFQRIPINTTRYAIADNDACPDCGVPALILETAKAPNYPKRY